MHDHSPNVRPKPKTHCGDLRQLHPALAGLTARQHWLAWRWKFNRKKWTKVPYQPRCPHNHARVNDPATWGAHQDAVDAFERGAADGIGFALFGSGIGAVDVDDCIDPVTGELHPWATDLVKRANTYVERTVGGAGLRIIGLIGASQQAKLHTRMEVPGTPIFVELYGYDAARYITISNLPLIDPGGGLANIDALLDELGRELNPARQQPRKQARPQDPSKRLTTTGGNDRTEASLPSDLLKLIRNGVPAGQRSDRFFYVVKRLQDFGWSMDEISTLLERYPRGIAEKYAGRLEQEISRAYGKGNGPGDNDALLEEMNQKYFVAPDGGKTFVVSFERERGRLVSVFMKFADFANLHLNRSAWATTNNGRLVKIPLGKWWLQHPDRRQYAGLTFAPGNPAEVTDGKFNLWRGWGVTPKQGDWSLMRAHIHWVLACGDDDAADYIIHWLAWAVQHPDQRAEVALVFQGKRGTGKSTLGNAMCKIFGQHAVHISNARHLVGNFNAHLRDCVFLFGDEAYWPGDKASEGALKRLITEPTLFIEPKGRDPITGPNFLHAMLSSNEDWVVPAGEGERRFYKCIVSETHARDPKWFEPLYAQLENGGYEAMLFDLLNFDLGDWHPRHLPRDAGLLDQQKLSLSPLDSWWVELLETGTLYGANPKDPGRAVSNKYETTIDVGSYERITTELGLYDQARNVEPRLRPRSDHMLGNYLREQGCDNTKKVMRRRGWAFPPLQECRAK